MFFPERQMDKLNKKRDGEVANAAFTVLFYRFKSELSSFNNLAFNDLKKAITI